MGECHGVPLNSAYRALSDPNRRQILWALRDGARPAAEIAILGDAPPDALMRHLGLLTAAGLIGTDGIRYWLKTSVLADVVLELAELAGIGTDVTRADLIEPLGPGVVSPG